MAKRGEGHYRRADLVRAIASAKDAGVNVGMIEVAVGKSNTLFRIYASGTFATPTPPENGTVEVMSAQEWDEEFAKLDAKKAEKKVAKKE